MDSVSYDDCSYHYYLTLTNNFNNIQQYYNNK